MARGDKLWEGLTTAQKKEIGDSARIGCSNKDIGLIVGIPETSFEECSKLRGFTAQKRALHRQQIRKDQAKHSLNTPVGSIWLGKNVLGQTDKQQVKHVVDEATASLLGLVDGTSRGKLPSEE